MDGKSCLTHMIVELIELAKASKSLQEAARIMKRTPERIRQVADPRLRVSFKSESKKNVDTLQTGCVNAGASSWPSRPPRLRLCRYPMKPRIPEAEEHHPPCRG